MGRVSATGLALRCTQVATLLGTPPNAVDVQQTGLYEVVIEARVTPVSGTWPAPPWGSHVLRQRSYAVGGSVGQSFLQSVWNGEVPATASWQAIGLYAQFSDNLVNVPALVPCHHADTVRERLHGRG